MSVAHNVSVIEREDFGPYEVYERLGVGGMATVHRAKKRGIEGFERIVALKRPLPHLAEDEGFVRSFVREAKLASLLQHTNIVQLYELGRVGAVYFMAMEYIKGCDLRRLLQEACRVMGPPPLPVFLSLMSQLCDALDYAHNLVDEHGEPLGLVHRDVTPSNLLVTDAGQLKIIDFGIAKVRTQPLRTHTGQLKGKLAYMAPETIRGRELDARSDIFAAGVIAHELLTMEPLFASISDYQTIMRVQRAPVAPPSRVNPACPPELDQIVLTALARDPGERWQSAAAFRNALKGLAERQDVSLSSSDVAQWMQRVLSAAAQLSSECTRTMAQPRASSSGHMLRSPGTRPSAELGSGGNGYFLRATSLPAVPPVGGVAPERMPERTIDEAKQQLVELAWGSRDSGPPRPVLLDDIPDFSNEAIPILQEDGKARTTSALPDTTGKIKRDWQERAAAEFGAHIIRAGKRRRRRKMILTTILFLAVAGFGGQQFMKHMEQANAVSHRPRRASVRLVIEPADATIEFLGYGTHQGSPCELEVVAPAWYRVTITRPGYKPHVTEVAVEGGQKSVVHVALVPESAGTAPQVQASGASQGTPVLSRADDDP